MAISTLNTCYSKQSLKILLLSVDLHYKDCNKNKDFTSLLYRHIIYYVMEAALHY